MNVPEESKTMDLVDDRQRPSEPQVSIIVPCYNEEQTIQLLLQSLYDQTFPRQDMEVVIADGLSTDNTGAEIEAFQQSHPDLLIRVIDNREQTIPSGLNQAIKAARGEIVVRLDAHSMPYPDYVSHSVADLLAGLGQNVGGVWEIRPSGENWIARAIAAAASHPLGVGDARYRTGGNTEESLPPQEVDTVPFGAYRRKFAEEIGLYDESLLTNEDYEFNVRIRQSGGRVWLNPEIRSVYFARRDIPSLARQYWRYGYWKARMLRRYPQTLRWRQLAPLFLVSLAFFGLLGFIWPPAWLVLFIELVLYGLALGLAGIQSGVRYRDLALLVGVPLAIGTMHFSWGAGFLWSLPRSSQPAP